MLITNVFLYHEKMSKYGINSEKLRNSIINMTGAYKTNNKIYGSTGARISRGGGARSSEKVTDPVLNMLTPAMNFKSLNTFFEYIL